MASHDLDFIQALKLDDAYGLEDARLAHLDALPRAGGFQKPGSRKPGGIGLSLEDVSQSYFKRGIFGERTFHAFTELSIRFDRSTIYGITGPSGCGKSSMIKAILRLLDGTQGTHHPGRPGPRRRSSARERGGDPGGLRPLSAQDGGGSAGFALRLLPGPAACATPFARSRAATGGPRSSDEDLREAAG